VSAVPSGGSEGTKRERKEEVEGRHVVQTSPSALPFLFLLPPGASDLTQLISHCSSLRRCCQLFRVRSRSTNGEIELEEEGGEEEQELGESG